MARRTLNRHELRAAHEAAEAMGLSNPEPKKAPRARTEPALRQTRNRAADAYRLGCLRRRWKDRENF